MQIRGYSNTIGRKYSTRTVTLIPGDGIGPEISASVQKIFAFAQVSSLCAWYIQYYSKVIESGFSCWIDWLIPVFGGSIENNEIFIRDPLLFEYCWANIVPLYSYFETKLKYFLATKEIVFSLIFYTPTLGFSRSGAYYEITVSLCQEIDLLITRTVFNLEPPSLVCGFMVVVLIV